MKKFITSLTISRIVLGLPLLIALSNEMLLIAFIILIMAAITDYLDGFLSRKYNLESVLGAKLDPLADKILILGPLLWLSKNNIVPIWSIWILLTREFLISIWRSNQKKGAPASIQGKIKTIFQFISILFLAWPNHLGSSSFISKINNLGYIFFWIAFTLAIISSLDYYFNPNNS